MKKQRINGMVILFSILLSANFAIGQIKTGRAIQSKGKLPKNTKVPKAQNAVQVGLNENYQKIKNLINDKNLQSKATSDLSENYEKRMFKGTEKQYVMNLMLQYQNCNNCPSAYKAFLLPLFEELVEAKNGMVASILTKYESKIHLLKDKKQREDLQFVFYSFKETVKKAFSNENMAEGIGKNIGRGIVGGFITGCLRGAYTGAVAGTTVVPGIGTVTGAVSGCIASGAVGAILGGIIGAFWGWADS